MRWSVELTISLARLGGALFTVYLASLGRLDKQRSPRSEVVGREV